VVGRCRWSPPRRPNMWPGKKRPGAASGDAGIGKVWRMGSAPRDTGAAGARRTAAALCPRVRANEWLSLAPLLLLVGVVRARPDKGVPRPAHSGARGRWWQVRLPNPPPGVPPTTTYQATSGGFRVVGYRLLRQASKRLDRLRRMAAGDDPASIV
jgi:hypothetical protein